MPNLNRTLRADIREAIARRLRTARKTNRIKAKDLAAALQIRADSLSQMELGRQSIPAELLVDWCNALRIPLRTIAEGIELPEPLDALPPRHARLFMELDPRYREVVLDTLESLAKAARSTTPTSDGE